MQNSLTIEVVQYEKLGLALAFLTGLICAQRFAGVGHEVVAPVLAIFVMAVFTKGVWAKWATASTAALIVMVDNGGSVYPETPYTIRYFILIFALLSVVMLISRFSLRRLVIAVALMLFYLTTTTLLIIDTPLLFSTAIMRRDLLAVFLVLACFLTRPVIKSGADFINVKLIISMCLGYLLGELVNVVFFYTDHNEYLNYDSTKAAVVLPAIMAIRYCSFAVVRYAIYIVTIYVLFHMGSRMLLLSLFVISILVVFLKLNLKLLTYALLASLIFYFVGSEMFIGLLQDSTLSHLKAFALVSTVFEGMREMNLAELLKLLDPIRFAEHVLVMDRPLAQLLFGSGLGSGIYDDKDYLHVAAGTPTSFSSQEMSSSIYFNFHDIWLDLGLRFGLLAVILISVIFIVGLSRHDHYKKYFLIIFFFINAAFSTSGLLLTALIYQYWPSAERNVDAG